MRSKASFKGHPIHPMLIPFPFAFLTGALLFDAAGLLLARPGLWATGGHLAAAGVLTALLAAVPGFIDYFYTVPPRSSGKQRATRHMLLNLTAVTLVAAAWLLRRGGDPQAPNVAVVGLELVAITLLSVAGWMGGTMAYRNQIGVDHRYAGAGKWQDQAIAASGGAAAVAKADELQVGQMKLLRLDGRRIVLGRSEDGYFAFDDRCTHKGGALSGGALICGIVQCPWHGSQFDVRTGQVKAGPAEEPITTFQVETRQGEIFLLVPGAGNGGR
jgi:nitrite reductase/ring-hydroxylating ferredoxin subunit/uncharacterized membrane protein